MGKIACVRRKAYLTISVMGAYYTLLPYIASREKFISDEVSSKQEQLHPSKGLYLPILTNERSSARMIGQAIAVPFLLFLFHTINRHLWFIDIGASGSTPTHQPFMELPDQEKKFPELIKKVRRGKAPLKQKALNTSMTWQKWSPSQAQDSKLESSYSC